MAGNVPQDLKDKGIDFELDENGKVRGLRVYAKGLGE